MMRIAQAPLAPARTDDIVEDRLSEPPVLTTHVHFNNNHHGDVADQTIAAITC